MSSLCVLTVFNHVERSCVIGLLIDWTRMILMTPVDVLPRYGRNPIYLARELAKASKNEALYQGDTFIHICYTLLTMRLHKQNNSSKYAQGVSTGKAD